MLADPAFAALLPPGVSQALDQDESLAIGVWRDLKTAYFNDAYVEMAKSFGGAGFLEDWGLGRSVLDAAPEKVRPFLRSLYESALRGEGLVTHSYLCPTPTEQRRFRSTYHPLRDNQGVLVVHRFVIANAPPVAEARPETAYRDDEGIMHQCANCRATKAQVGSRWDFVPGFIVKMPDSVSHGLCPACETFF